MNTYTISEISEKTGFSRLFISHSVNSSDQFKAVISKGRIKYETVLSVDGITLFLKEKKSESKKRIGNKNRLGGTKIVSSQNIA
jgi:hypothetical protein